MRPAWMFAAVLGLAFALRLGLALSFDGYLGVDGGASLLTVNYVLGDEPTGAGFPKPPLAPGWLLAPFALLMGPDLGYKVWSSLFALFPLIPVYLLTRHYVNAVFAVYAAVFAAVDVTWAEMFVTGAHPLPAFALLGTAWWCLAVLSQRQSVKVSLLLAGCIGLIPWVNQTAASLAVITLPIVWLWTYAIAPTDSGRSAFFWRTAGPVFLGAVVGVAALPWYMRTLPGSDILTFDGPTLYWAWTWATGQAFLFAFPLGGFILWKAPRQMKALGLVLVVLGVMGNFLSFDEVIINPLYRARYLMALAFYPCMAWVVDRYWLPRVNFRWAAGFAGAALVYMLAFFVLVAHTQQQYSEMVTPATANALEYAATWGSKRGIATNSFTLSLWVAALNKVPSPFAFTAPPPPAYVEDDVDLRCVYNWIDSCDPYESAKRLDVEYLLVEERFPEYNQFAPPNYLAPPDQWQRTAEAPWLELVYSEGTTRLWRIAPHELTSTR